MVEHVIIWTLKEEYNTKEVKENMKKAIERLLGVVPGIVEIRLEINPMETSNADVMLYSVLESKDALKNYATHPEHVKVADDFVRPFVKAKACFDCEK